MTKIWHIIKYEYSRHVLTKRFLFSLLSLPMLVLAMFLVSLLIALIAIDTSPIGFVDHSGILADPTPLEVDGSIFNPIIDFLPYPNESQAQNDLEEELIQAYYVIPETFPETRDITLYFLDTPDGGAQARFRQFILQNMGGFEGLDPLVEERLKEGSLITVTTLDGSREMREDQWFMLLLPTIMGLMFVVVIMTSGGYLLQAVVEEKENRTMEIVITSVTPGQLMTGKTIGNISVGLTQLIVWLLFALIALTIGGNIWPFLQDISISPEYFVIMIFIFLPSFIMVAAIMSTIGAIMTEMREAQQISGLFSLLIIIPFYVTTPLMNNPNGLLAVVLSYFPLTAPITILMRMAYTSLPLWEIILAIGIMIVFAILAVWFAGRAFRMGMLQYGKRLTLKDLFGKFEVA
jgi:ABC-2 type transport system permease protein